MTTPTFAPFREKQSALLQTTEGLRDLARELGAKSLGDKMDRDLVVKLREDRFHLVVVGEFNHGKSTFVNALLGTPALASGVTPTTAAIHHVRFAEKPEAFVVGTDGTRTPLPFDAVKNYSVSGGKTTDVVDYIEIGYPSELLRERVLLVDTPGVNDLSLQRSDITYSYIPRADAVLFLLDAGQILKESERVFLQDKLLKASRDKIIFVVTKWDLLSPEERKEAFHYAKVQLANLVQGAVVFPVSAESELKGDKALGGFEPLVAYLGKFLAEERGRVVLDNAVTESEHSALLLRKGLEARLRASSMNVEEIDRRIQLLERDLAGQAGTIEQRRMELREEIATIRTTAKKDLEKFAADLTRDIPATIDQAKAEDLKTYLPAFLEDTFRKWAEAETKEVAASLEALAEKTIALVKEDANASGKRLSDLLGSGEVKRLDVKVDTLRYDAGVFALFAVGFGTLFANVLLGGVLLAMAPVVAMAMKGRIEGEYRKRAKEVAPEVIREAASKMGPTLDAMILEVGKKLEDWVVTAGEELHREILEVLRETKREREKSGANEANERTAAESKIGRLETIQKDLANFRASLWSDPGAAG